jgi:hypothetical protein
MTEKGRLRPETADLPVEIGYLDTLPAERLPVGRDHLPRGGLIYRPPHDSGRDGWHPRTLLNHAK